MTHLKPTSLSLASLLWATTALAEAPSVVTDIAPVHALVARVMEGVGTPDLLLPPGASPHGYAMRPSEARMLNEAELFVWIGPSLTPWLDGPLDALASEAEALSLMALPGTSLLEVREGAGFEGGHDHGHGDEHHEEHDGEHGEEGHEDHSADKDHEDHESHADHEDHEDHESHDDHDHKEHADHKDHEDHEDHDAHGHEDHEDHAEHKEAEHEAHEDEDHADHADEDHAEADHAKDPHVWLDPRNAQVWLPVIAEHLAELDPENAARYAANAAAGQAELAALETELAAQLVSIKGKPFVVFHDAYQPFEARFGVSAVASVSPSDAQKPGAGRISRVQEVVTETGAVCGFAEPQLNPALLNVVMEGQEAFEIATLDPLGTELPLGAALYPDMLRGLAAAMVACLGGK